MPLSGRKPNSFAQIIAECKEQACAREQQFNFYLQSANLNNTTG
jgi:hypothetical protein